MTSLIPAECSITYAVAWFRRGYESDRTAPPLPVGFTDRRTLYINSYKDLLGTGLCRETDRELACTVPVVTDDPSIAAKFSAAGVTRTEVPSPLFGPIRLYYLPAIR